MQNHGHPVGISSLCNVPMDIDTRPKLLIEHSKDGPMQEVRLNFLHKKLTEE